MSSVNQYVQGEEFQSLARQMAEDIKQLSRAELESAMLECFLVSTAQNMTLNNAKTLFDQLIQMTPSLCPCPMHLGEIIERYFRIGQCLRDYQQQDIASVESPAPSRDEEMGPPGLYVVRVDQQLAAEVGVPEETEEEHDPDCTGCAGCCQCDDDSYCDYCHEDGCEGCSKCHSYGCIGCSYCCPDDCEGCDYCGGSKNPAREED